MHVIRMNLWHRLTLFVCKMDVPVSKPDPAEAVYPVTPFATIILR